MATVEQLTIQFEGKGSKKLTNQLKALSAAMDRLARRQKKVNNGSVLGIKNNRLLSNSFATLRSKLLLLSFGFGILSKAVLAQVKAFGVQEASVRRLSEVFGTQGAKALDEYSSELQKVSNSGDEAINVVMAQIGAFGTNIEQTKALTKATLDLSAGMGIDLNTAGLLVAKSIGSSTNALTRYGIELDSNSTKSQKIAELTQSVEDKFGGLAEELSKTTQGKLNQASMAFGDAAEQIGQFLAPAVLKTAKAFQFLAEQINVERIKSLTTSIIAVGTATALWQLKTVGVSKALKSATTAMLAFNSAIKKNLIGLLTTAAVVAATAVLDFFDVFEDNQDELDNNGKELLDNAEKMKEYQAKVDDVNESLQKKLDILKASTEIEKFAIQNGIELVDVNKELFESLKNLREEEEGRKALRKESIKFASDMAQSFLESSNTQMQAVKDQQSFELEQLRNSTRYQRASDRTKQKLEKEILDRNKKNMKNAFENNQNARIGQAIIDTYSGMTRALSDHAMPYAGIIASMVGVMGLKNVQQIKAQEPPKFAYGGLVGGRSHSQGGTMIEAERGEYVISRAGVESAGIEALNRINAGGGGGVNVSINNPILSKDVVEDDLIPQIKEAIRRGADIGVG